MRKSSEIKNETKVRASSEQFARRTASLYPFDVNSVPKAAKRLYDAITTALRAMTVAMSVENSDFFASYDNLAAIAKLFDIHGIRIVNIDLSKRKFEENAAKCWIELLLLLFTALSAMPNDGGVYCERIEYGGLSEYLTVSVRSETMDARTHVLGLMLREDGERLVTVDNQVMMFCQK